jgi:hypothetical protein
MTELIRVEVTDQHGIVAEFADPAALRQLSPRQRGQLDALAVGLVRDVAAATGSGEDHARQVATADLVRLIADETAYSRVCQRKGLLAL